MQDVKSHDREIVSAIRRAVAERVGAERYDLWFASTCDFEVRGDRLAVVVPNTFLQDWLRTNFRVPLESALREVLGPAAVVVFEVEHDAGRSRDAERTEPRARRQRTTKPATANRRCDSSDRSTIGDAPVVKPKRITNPRRLHDFDEFVVGATNRLAYVSALGVVERLGGISPLFLYGPTGVGKTHLLEATVETVRRSSADARTTYLSAEQFTTEFLEALHGKGLPIFRRKFRDLHLLVVDDIQFLGGKKATVIELTHTIDALQRAGRQVVLSADRAPADLAMLGPEMRNRLTSGLACKLEAPDLTTRLGITTRMATRLGMMIPDDVRHFIATNFSAHARELAGAIEATARRAAGFRSSARSGVSRPKRSTSCSAIGTRPCGWPTSRRRSATCSASKPMPCNRRAKGTTSVVRGCWPCGWRESTRGPHSARSAASSAAAVTARSSRRTRKSTPGSSASESMQVGFGRCRFDEALAQGRRDAARPSGLVACGFVVTAKLRLRRSACCRSSASTAWTSSAVARIPVIRL